MLILLGNFCCLFSLLSLYTTLPAHHRHYLIFPRIPAKVADHTWALLSLLDVPHNCGFSQNSFSASSLLLPFCPVLTYNLQNVIFFTYTHTCAVRPLRCVPLSSTHSYICYQLRRGHLSPATMTSQSTATKRQPYQTARSKNKPFLPPTLRCRAGRTPEFLATPPACSRRRGAAHARTRIYV